MDIDTTIQSALDFLKGGNIEFEVGKWTILN